MRKIQALADRLLETVPAWRAGGKAGSSVRHRRGLPVRGQRTHTNARTRKGPAKSIAGKKK